MLSGTPARHVSSPKTSPGRSGVRTSVPSASRGARLGGRAALHVRIARSVSTQKSRSTGQAQNDVYPSASSRSAISASRAAILG